MEDKIEKTARKIMEDKIENDIKNYSERPRAYYEGYMLGFQMRLKRFIL